MIEGEGFIPTVMNYRKTEQTEKLNQFQNERKYGDVSSNFIFAVCKKSWWFFFSTCVVLFLRASLTIWNKYSRIVILIVVLMDIPDQVEILYQIYNNKSHLCFHKQVLAALHYRSLRAPEQRDMFRLYKVSSDVHTGWIHGRGITLNPNNYMIDTCFVRLCNESFFSFLGKKHLDTITNITTTNITYTSCTFIFQHWDFRQKKNL